MIGLPIGTGSMIGLPIGTGSMIGLPIGTGSTCSSANFGLLFIIGKGSAGIMGAGLIGFISSPPPCNLFINSLILNSILLIIL